MPVVNKPGVPCKQAEDSRRDRRDDGTCGSRELFLLAQHAEAENPYRCH